MKCCKFYFYFISVFLLHYTSNVDAQVFNGVIQYEVNSNLVPGPDTITYFFSDSIIVNRPAKGAVEISNEPFIIWLLKEGKNFVYNQQKRAWEETVFNPERRSTINVFDSLTTGKEILGFNCDQYLLKSSFQSPYGQMGSIEQLWVAKELKFEIPFPEFKRVPESLFNNPSHRIVLFREIMPDATATDPALMFPGNPNSTLQAISINTELPPLFFEIIRAFRENRAVWE